MPGSPARDGHVSRLGPSNSPKTVSRRRLMVTDTQAASLTGPPGSEEISQGGHGVADARADPSAEHFAADGWPVVSVLTWDLLLLRGALLRDGVHCCGDFGGVAEVVVLSWLQLLIELIHQRNTRRNI